MTELTRLIVCGYCNGLCGFGEDEDWEVCDHCGGMGVWTSEAAVLGPQLNRLFHLYRRHSLSAVEADPR